MADRLSDEQIAEWQRESRGSCVGQTLQEAQDKFAKHIAHKAYRAGQEAMREDAARVIEDCNKAGPYEAIGAANIIRALPISEE